MERTKKVLLIEPFYGGSHQQLIDSICSHLPKECFTLITMTAKKWHWRARTSALYISTQIPRDHRYKVLFCTSVLPLAELLGLRSDLSKLTKVVYFHENQLEYPVRITKERDFQYGYNEILTCLSADKVLFNSFYNFHSFLKHINTHLKIQPDFNVRGLDLNIEPKCQVIYYPLDLISIDKSLLGVERKYCNKLHIVWPHRWEFDKNPDAFYRVICKLDDSGLDFLISILGESFTEKPEILLNLSAKFKGKLIQCGFISDTAEYYKFLKNADVVVSTAIHEYFGVAILEAVYCGCIPIVPKRLSYKELYEGKVNEMYNTEEELYNILAQLCEEKSRGQLNRNYKHLAVPFESNRWFQSFLQCLDCEL